MASETINYKFNKPGSEDVISPEPFNNNFDIVDEKLKSVEDKQTEFDTKLESVNDTTDEISEALITIRKKQVGLETAHSKTSTEVTKITEKQTEFDKKLTETTQKQTEVDTKFTEIDTKFTEVNEKLEQGADLTEVNAKFTEIDTKFTEIDTKFTEVNEKLEKGADLTEVNAKFTEIEEKQTEFDSELTELNDKIKNIDTTPRNIATAEEIRKVLDGDDYVSVFGVVWDSSDPSTALTRLTPDTDPYKLVTESAESEPAPGDGGSSPFDNFMPWSGMMETTMIDTNEMVFIPAFWFSHKENGAKHYFYIANKETDGMVQHPGSNKYVGRYTYMGSTFGSSYEMSELKTNISRSSARTRAKNLGEKYHLYDFATYCAIVMLYLVEYADWDSEAKVGGGNVSADTTVCYNIDDYLDYHTGIYAERSGSTTYGIMQYRNIVNVWGNLYQWIDGINVNGVTAYYCTDPSKYADDTTEGYTELGNVPKTGGYIKNVMVTDDGLLLPTASGGAEGTYIPDWVGYLSGWTGACVGGSYKDTTYAGILAFETGVRATSGLKTVTARLMCEP